MLFLMSKAWSHATLLILVQRPEFWFNCQFWCKAPLTGEGWGEGDYQYPPAASYVQGAWIPALHQDRTATRHAPPLAGPVAEW